MAAVSRCPFFAAAFLIGLYCGPAFAAHYDAKRHDFVASTRSRNDSIISHNGSLIISGFQTHASYFCYPDHAELIYAHIFLMVLAWVIILPLAVMLSLVRSRRTIALQIAFLAANATGVLTAALYNVKTPDLYPSNAHHKLGWIGTWTASAHVLTHLIKWIAITNYDDHTLKYSIQDRPAYFGDTSFGLTHNNSVTNSADERLGDLSFTLSRRSTALDAVDQIAWVRNEATEVDEAFLNHTSSIPRDRSKIVLLREFINLTVPFGIRFLCMVYQIFNRVMLPAGFILLTTGVVAFGGLFKGESIFNGLAHWIKGGVFFWLGLLTLGRWCGSFADLGWAWNLRLPVKRSTSAPSAELVESSLILVYGSTNIFLEHLGGSGRDWTAQDLEHVAIAALFIGGGLCGVLVESTKIRDLLSVTVTCTQLGQHRTAHDEIDQRLQEPPTANVIPLNPMPALFIMLVGTLMSSHRQSSTVSTMLHKQWGNLLTGASCARILTYLLLYIHPPRSVLPSRPPTELLASFGLIAGGLLFMMSSSDTISGIIHYDLDAMVVFTVTSGVAALLMAWEIVVLAIKGQATQSKCRDFIFVR